MSLAMQGVTYAYPGTDEPILRDITFEVAAGESVAVVAPSGAGKSTLLQLAGLLLFPQAGHIRIGETDVSPGAAQHLLGREVVWVLQTVSLFPRRSVIDNTVLPALASGRERREAETFARELLEQLGVADAAAQTARQLSGGQAQRVGVARALMSQPTLMLADEPTANLDLTTAREVAKSLFATAAGRTSLLLATHDPAVAAMAHRRIDLHDLQLRGEHVVSL